MIWACWPTPPGPSTDSVSPLPPSARRLATSTGSVTLPTMHMQRIVSSHCGDRKIKAASPWNRHLRCLSHKARFLSFKCGAIMSRKKILQSGGSHWGQHIVVQLCPHETDSLGGDKISRLSISLTMWRGRAAGLLIGYWWPWPSRGTRHATGFLVWQTWSGSTCPVMCLLHVLCLPTTGR